MGMVPTLTVLPLYCTAFGMVGKFNTLLHADRKCLA